MLSVRNMLTSTKEECYRRPSVLEISSLLNTNDTEHKTLKQQHQMESRKIEQSIYAYFNRDDATTTTTTIIPTVKLKRRRASSKQVDILNRVFERTYFPSTQLRAELGRQLGMSPRTVQIWFQNRRQALKSRRSALVLSS